MNLPDVQNLKGNYNFPVKAGIKGIKMPIHVKTKAGDLIRTIADVDMQVRLDRQLKGINMSRLPIILSEMQRNSWVLDNLRTLLSQTMDVMESDAAYVNMRFPYFYDKRSPVSHFVGTAHCMSTFTGLMTSEQDSYRFVLGVDVPVMTLCPCSKEISRQSAHNQRATVSMQIVYGTDFVWIEDLVAIAEESASTGLYPILKRVDEKFVTESSYAKPRFVEDVARIVANRLTLDGRVQQYHVVVTSEESIHQHDAVAEVEGGLRDIWCL